MPTIFRSQWGRPAWRPFKDDDGIIHAANKLSREDAVHLGFDAEVTDSTYYARCDNDMFLYDRSKGAVNCIVCLAEPDDL